MVKLCYYAAIVRLLQFDGFIKTLKKHLKFFDAF